MEKKFIDRIESLKRNTTTSINDIQVNCCPMIKEIYLKYQFEWWYDGYKYKLWEDDTHIYAVNELPYCYDNNIKNTIFKENLWTLIQKDVMFPFLMFINGHVVPWSTITVIKDYDYTYLRIDGEKDDILEKAIIIYFPISSKNIRYGEDEDILHGKNIAGLYFNENYKYIYDTSFQSIKVRLEILKDRIYFAKYIMDGIGSTSTLDYVPNNYTITLKDLPDGYIPTYKNFIFFDKDGDFIGYPEYTELFEINDDLTCNLGIVKFKKSLERHFYYGITMYFMEDNKSCSYLYTQDLDKDKIKAGLSTDSDKPYEVDVTKWPEFDFKMSANNTYDRNLRISAKYISQYNMGLWNDVFINESRVKSITYKGRDFKKLSDNMSHIKMSRRFYSEYIEDVAMMFVNNKLYVNNIDITYTDNTINLPTFGIMDDDNVEIILFTRCNNNILNIVVPSSSDEVYIHPEYNLDDCYIMDTETSLSKYPDTPISYEGRRQYICKLSYTKERDNYYKIRFEDSSHYGKKLKIVPKAQFRYYRYTATRSSININDAYKFILPTSFNYCHDINHYVIFVNGKKIDKSEYTITIMNENRPFDKLVLYMTTFLELGDIVDIYYVPEYWNEKYKELKVKLNGCIHLKTDYPKLYALSKNTSMIFVNGYKVHPYQLTDISMNRMLVDTEINNIHNITVVEYLDGASAVAKYLYGMDGYYNLMGDLLYDDEQKDLKPIIGSIIGSELEKNETIVIEDLDFDKKIYDGWTEIVDSIISYFKETEGLDKIFKMKPPMVTKLAEKNYKDDYLPLKAVLYDIVQDYYIKRSGVNTGRAFTYDFEIEEWNKDDLDNNIIDLFPSEDEHGDTMFEYRFTDKEADDQDVISSKKYEKL